MDKIEQGPSLKAQTTSKMFAKGHEMFSNI